MPTYVVSVTIENKPGISDPEGMTILNDLVLRNHSAPVSEIKTAKMLKFKVTIDSKDEAEDMVRQICDELRIYNPLVSVISVDVTQV